MTTLRESIDDFLACRRIAVAGMSREGHQPGNYVYDKLKRAGYQVFAVNPAADEIEGEVCYADLGDVPGGVDAVVVATPPEAASHLVERCAELGIGHVWLHRSFGTGSVSETAVETARTHGISVIGGACPMMYVPPVDPAHACMRWLLTITGGLPKGDGDGTRRAA